MKENEIRKILSIVCGSYIDGISANFEENVDVFPYLLACANFIVELKSKNIIVDINAFADSIKDRIFREVANYIGK